MTDVTHLLDAAAAGDRWAAADVVQLLYDELRTLAASAAGNGVSASTQIPPPSCTSKPATLRECGWAA